MVSLRSRQVLTPAVIAEASLGGQPLSPEINPSGFIIEVLISPPGSPMSVDGHFPEHGPGAGLESEPESAPESEPESAPESEPESEPELAPVSEPESAPEPGPTDIAEQQQLDIANSGLQMTTMNLV
ncbi:hypothetical protein LPJ81_002505, partial [Coemansia sp. IMI 209127]